MRSIESERQMRKGMPSASQYDVRSTNTKRDTFGLIVALIPIALS